MSCLARPPRLTTTRAHLRVVISGLNRTAFDLAVYASQGWSPTHHARLASGCWSGSTGRDWLPAGFHLRGSSPCLGSVDVTPWRTRLDFPDCHYITVSSPSGGVGGFKSVNFNAFRTRRVRAASTDPATFRSIVHAKRHQAYRLERLHRPLRREVDPRLLKPAIQEPLHQERRAATKICAFTRASI